ncbi:MAG: transcription elongation factor GreA [Deltaproteobacteria bacterium]|nr:transcription elongation factor GreA [Deltaproteobacteria bacterium]
MKHPMTPKGHQALTEELHRLKTTERPKIIAEVAEARSHGDLSENAEYDAAREKHSLLEGRIRAVEGKLAAAHVIHPYQIDTSRVVFGVTVTIADADTGDEQTWTLVGEDEADLKIAKISISSPIARAMIGKSVGDQFEIRTPRGIKECEIILISI